jgi:hypothetical protein
MSEGIRFKTGFLNPLVSSGDIAKKIGDGIIEDINKIQQLQLVEQERKDRRFGFTKTLQEVVPGGLTNKWVPGAQLLLEEVQSKSAKALQTGSSEDIQAYQAAKTEYNNFKNIASATSAFDNNTRKNITTGSIQGMMGTQEENLQKFIDQDSSEVKMEGGKLLVLDNGTFVPWDESYLGDSSNVFMPQLEWEGSQFTFDKYSNTLYNNKYKSSSTLYEETDTEFGRPIGKIKEELFYSDIKEDVINAFRLNPQGVMEASGALAYKAYDIPGKAEMSQDDFAKSSELYTLELNNKKIIKGDGDDAKEVSVVDGNFNNEGDFIFTLSDKELDDNGLQTSVKSRKSYKLYMEQTADLVRGKMGVRDQSGLIEALRLEKLAEEEQALLEAQAEKQEANAELQEFAPDLFNTTYKKDGKDIPGVAIKVNVSGQNFQMQIENKKTDGKGVGKGRTGAKLLLNNVVYDETNGDIIALNVFKAIPSLGKLADFKDASQYTVEDITVDDPRFDEVFRGFLRVKQASGKPSLRQLIELSQPRLKSAIQKNQDDFKSANALPGAFPNVDLDELKAEQAQAEKDLDEFLKSQK